MKKYSIILLVCLSFSFTDHKYYLSLTEIKHNTEHASLELIMNVFMDDIELALNKEFSIDLQLDTQKELSNNDSYFERYLTKHLHLKTDGEVQKINYLGKEYQGDVVYLYLEVENISSLKNMEIENTMLLAYLPEQQNLIKASANGIHRSKLLTKKNDKALLNF